MLAAAATAGVSALSGSVTADGSSTARPVHDRRRRGLPEEEQGGTRHGRHLRHGRRLRAVLPQRDRPLERVAADEAGRGGQVPRRRRQVGRVHGRERRPLGRRQQAEHVGELPHGRRAEEGLGAGLEGQQLEPDPRQLPERAAEALRRRHRLGHVRLLHRGDQRQGEGEPLRLPRDRGRQRRRPGGRGRARCDGLLRLLLLRGEQGQAEGARDRPGQGPGLRHAERRDRAGEQVPPALAAALHLLEAHLVQAAGRGRLHRLHLQQREGDREEVRLHRPHRPPAEEGPLPVPAGAEVEQQPSAPHRSIADEAPRRGASSVSPLLHHASSPRLGGWRSARRASER